MHPADALAERLGLPVRDRDLLVQALTHSSWLHEHPDAAPGHNERLEFLGDAVVSLAVSEALYRRHPADDEGVLSARRAAIVSTPGLARLATRIDLGPSLQLGEGEAQRGGRVRPSLLASAFEALIGAIYLDLGWEAARDWIHEMAAEELAADLAIDDAQEPQEPAPGAHPAHHRRAADVPAGRGRRSRPREAVPDRGPRRAAGRSGWARGRRAGSRRRRPPPRRSTSCVASAPRAKAGARRPRRPRRRCRAELTAGDAP